MSARSMIRARRRIENRRRPKRSAALAITGAALLAAPGAEAATFTVTNTNDAGAGSLRAAIMAANEGQSPDTIEFAASAAGTINLASTLVVGSPMTIQGPGAETLAISGGDARPIFDVGGLTDPGQPVTISGLKLVDGRTTARGGAIANTDQIAFPADLRVSSMVFDSNYAVQGGGAVYDYRGNLKVTDSTFTGNSSPGNTLGGGLYVKGTLGDSGDNVVISGSTFSANSAGDGGAAHLSLDGDFLIDDTKVSGNMAGDEGGGMVFATDPVGEVGGRIESSTFSGNTAVNGGGGFWLRELTDQLTVSDSTITGNSASYGGGIANYQTYDAPLEIRNSTIAGNTAVAYGGGIARFAYDNPASPGDDDIDLSSTIVAGNSAPQGADLSNQFPPNGPTPSGTVTAGFSLIGDTAGNVTLTESPAGSILLNADPQLGPLADNGGPTQTMLPALTSPAIDAGIANGLTTDQRGLPRTIATTFTPSAGSDGTDIGAVELQDDGLIGVTLKAKKKQKAKRKIVIKVEVGAGEEVEVSAKGKLKAGKAKGKLKKATETLDGGETKKLKLKPKGEKTSKKVNGAIDDDRKGKVTVSVEFTDPAGNSKSRKKKVTLK